MNLQPVFIREHVIKATRDFFYKQQFHEVLTPTFNAALPLEPNIYAFETAWETIYGTKKLYLSTSPESGLKKMLALGIGNCFAFGKSFRNLEAAGSTHIPEFLMLEWYREHASYTDIMDDTEQLIQFIIDAVDSYLRKKSPVFARPWPRYTMTFLFQQYAQMNLVACLDDTVMKKTANKKGYKVTDATWEQLFNQIFLNEIESQFEQTPFFVIDFPTRISPLCTPKKDQPNFAERFEVYVAGIELGNGNTEHTNARKIKELFLQEQTYREKAQILTPPIDEEFLAALSAMERHSYAGIGLGIDRLAMLLAEVTTIAEIEPLSVAQRTSV